MKQTETNSYTLWLWAIIHYNDHKEYRNILSILYDVSFYSLVPYDDNRAHDGLGLRHSYKNETGVQPPNGDCTVLEVLIAIAERMSYLLYDPDLENEDQIHIWFWRLIDNLRLDPLDDYYQNIDKVHFWLRRDYAENGCGGLFPLKDPIDNQKEIEIWYQMQAYINEILF